MSSKEKINVCDILRELVLTGLDLGDMVYTS